MNRCMQCGSLNGDSAAFCASCRCKLSSLSAAPRQPSFFHSALRRKMELENAPDLYWKGIDALQADDAALAAETLQAAVVSDPDFAPSYAALALAFEQQEQLDQAIPVCEKALALDPSSTDYHSILGRLLVRLGRVKEALVEFEKSASLDPENTFARNQMARLSLLQNDYHSAERWCREVFQLDPEDPEPHRLLGQVYAELQRFDEAMAEFRRALALRTLSIEAQAVIHCQIGDLLAQREDWLGAAQQYQCALKADNFHREARRKLQTARLASEVSSRARRQTGGSI